MYNGDGFILGAGITGLAAGIATGFPVFEAEEKAGGICYSYYIRPGSRQKLSFLSKDGAAYRFEIGGGHWIFGADQKVLSFIRDLTVVKSYNRKSAVYFSKRNLYVPYPLQYNLDLLNSEIAEITSKKRGNSQNSSCTMKEWLSESFGQSLCELFFYPFHDLYTAGLYEQILPQDTYKSPTNLSPATQNPRHETLSTGYNAMFVYPEDGLNTLVQPMADSCKVQYDKRVVKIDLQNKKVYFADNSAVFYRTLISTLPLNRMLEITGLMVDEKPDPYTSVLVLNIGAVRGKRCPDYHWLYIPDSNSQFYRVGFYSNVDSSFLPKSTQKKRDHVGIYVERAYIGGSKPTCEEAERYSDSVVKELQKWGFIDEVEIVDPTWIDIAYTWKYPCSFWREKALRMLEEHNIHQVGRYGRWAFQGIADSLKDGFSVAQALKGVNESRRQYA